MDGRGQSQRLRSRAGDAQGKTVPRKLPHYPESSTLLVLGLGLGMGALLVPTPGLMAQGTRSSVAEPSKVSGVVRDAQGVAQMGALVQVLAANSMTVGTAFTDQHGHYVVQNLTPGSYFVRASAALFVPVTKANLELRSGANTVVNLTMAALFDTAAWLPAQRRRADETADDWKWTLRSTANKPILRMVEDGSVIEVSSSATEASVPLRAKALGAFESGDGSFGRGGLHNKVTVHQALDDGSDMMLRTDVGTATEYGSAPSEFDLGYEGRTGFDGGASRTVVSYVSHPDLVAEGGPGLEVMQVTSAQRMSVGERVEVEAGGRMTAVHAGESAFRAHPFVRVSAHPAGEWTLEYRMATDLGLQEFDDVTSGDADVPVALVRNGRLALESGRHQEFSVAHRTGKASVQVTVYHDGSRSTAVSGGEAGAVPTAPAGIPTAPAGMPSAPTGMLLDPTTGSFRALGAGFHTDGTRFTVSSALTPALWLAAEYSTGSALTLPDDFAATPLPFDQMVGTLTPRRSQTATLALKGRIVGTGTRVRASYRWQPLGQVTAVDPYSAFGDQAYLSCLVRQPLRMGKTFPKNMEATIDVTNLLAQGYRPFVSADGQTLYFAQAPRTIQAGLSFSF